MAELSALEIADALERPRPTDEQRAVIEAPLVPALVVAGAGSGKTETMASRVLWLLANGFVGSEQILGLTFTRKAAAELQARIRDRIAQLARAGLLADGYDPFAAPTVATYNSYANALYRDNAVVLGREGDGAVLGEAAAWQLARETVRRSTNPGLPDLGKGLDPLTRAVLAVSRAVAENAITSPQAVREYASRFAALAELPRGGAGAYADVDRWVETVGALDVLLDLAAEYESAKAARGLVEYSDQVALALRILRKRPEVAQTERDRFRVVLLDEYQDTSVVQTWMLAELFAGHPVMAVGDPNQSIYGWRGASASNLDDFGRAFGTGARYSLSTSWRNGARILDAANTLVEPLRGRVAVDTLRPAPTASELPVETLFPESVAEEADAVAEWLGARLARGKPSAALLLRTRKTQGYFLDALRRRGIPFHVLGIGGLLAEPEIADLVCALQVIHDPSAGLELLRLLAGSRWRLGVADLHALGRIASWLRDRDYAQRPYEDSLREQLRSVVTDGEGGSIVDALDFVAAAKPDHSQLKHFTPAGLERLREAGRTFARLRQRGGLDLPDFVAFVLQELRLDIEVAANPHRPLGTATMDALFDALGGYLALAEVATLGGFLSWLKEAELREDLSPRPDDPKPGTVQVLTIHGAKGLEWDLVAIPRMVEEELPGRPAEGGYQGWLGFGQLPWVFRGDAAELPALRWEDATTRKELVNEHRRYREAVREHLLAEERRLAYVAVTRARHALLLSGSFWATQVGPREPSRFIRELESAGVVAGLPEASTAEQNPMGENLELLRWPLDPLAGRRQAVEAAAQAVRSATPTITGPWARDLELLLEERRARLGASGLVAMPARVPASRFKDFVADPAAVASALLRPMPQRPYRATQLGTLFHSWVEERYSGADELDALPTELDAGEPVAEDALAALKATFDRSPWAARRPVEVECELHLPFAGRIVICKIDAVYRDEGDRYEIVDWKTGKAPRDAEDLEQRQLQLALYRLAYARWKNIEPDRIDAVFYFVADDVVIRPQHLYGEEELLARWQSAFSGTAR